jgi:hypothetical protein
MIMKPSDAQTGKYGFGEIGTRMNKGYRIRSIGQALSCASAQTHISASLHPRACPFMQSRIAASADLGKSSLG